MIGMLADSTATELGAVALGLEPSVRSRAARKCNPLDAFELWSSLLGSEHVLADAATRSEYSKTTLPHGTTPLGVIRPGRTKEVVEAVKIADRFGIKLHTISRGKNWGYGDACAPTDGQVIVDLGRMNRIREVNVELGYAVIEPGVTQGQMYEYLVENKLQLLLDVTGAGPEASIVGNLLQRGFGHTPYGDRFRHTSGLEVVLSDGRLVNTGFGQYENAKAANVFPWGVGPWIDGLFTQSNLGIVTSACIWLMPKPEVIEGFALKIDNDDQLGGVLDTLRRLRMGGTIRSTVHVANDLRVLSSRMRYPWERAGGKAPLPVELRRELRAEHGLGAWNVLGASYGTQTEVRAMREVIRKAFRPITRAYFFRRKTLDRARSVIDYVKWTNSGQRLASATAAAGSAFDLLEGIPTPQHLEGAFWRHHGDSSDLRDAGLIWISPVLPLHGESAREVLSIVKPIFEEYGFEPLITMSAVTERALCCLVTIHLAEDTPTDVSQAQAFAVKLQQRLARAGYYSNC